MMKSLRMCSKVMKYGSMFDKSAGLIAVGRKIWFHFSYKFFYEVTPITYTLFKSTDEIFYPS